MPIHNLRVLTYNVKMLPGPFGDGDRDIARAKRIAQAIAAEKPCWDVVCLQEVFDENARAALSKGLKKQLPFQVTKSQDGDLFQEDSGLFFASRFPIARKGFKEFGRSADSDGLADKGIFGAHIAIGKSQALFFNTHLQSSLDRAPVRRFQLREIRRFVRAALERTDGKKPAAVLLLGDANVVGEGTDGKPTNEYLGMIARLGSPRDLFREKHAPAAEPGFTWDGSRNVLVPKKDHDKQRLDYVLAWDTWPELHDNDTPPKVGSVTLDAIEVRPFETARANVCLSDHFAVDARISIMT